MNEAYLNYVNSIKFGIQEGSLCKEALEYLQKLLLDNSNITSVLEIGFNGGLSAAAILSARPNIKLTSVDIGIHPYVHDAKKLIDECFPGQHELIIGNSKDVIPKLPKHTYHLIFIDGSHEEPLPKIDIENCYRLASADTLVLIDDWCDRFGRFGVNKAILEKMSDMTLKIKDYNIISMKDSNNDLLEYGWGLFNYRK